MLKKNHSAIETNPSKVRKRFIVSLLRKLEMLKKHKVFEVDGRRVAVEGMQQPVAILRKREGSNSAPPPSAPRSPSLAQHLPSLATENCLFNPRRGRRN